MPTLARVTGGFRTFSEPEIEKIEKQEPLAEVIAKKVAAELRATPEASTKPVVGWIEAGIVIGVSARTIARRRADRSDKSEPWWSDPETCREWWKALTAPVHKRQAGSRRAAPPSTPKQVLQDGPVFDLIRDIEGTVLFTTVTPDWGPSGFIVRFPPCSDSDCE